MLAILCECQSLQWIQSAHLSIYMANLPSICLMLSRFVRRLLFHCHNEEGPGPSGAGHVYCLGAALLTSA